MGRIDADAVVVGAGIVGLACARELLRRRPGSRLVVLEKEAGVGRHQTGHNSGVVHSGVYYAPGSLRARTCVEGAARLRRFCAERGVPLEERGKVIVAVRPEELPRLDELVHRGRANGVAGVQRVGPGRLRDLEPHVRALAAVHVPGAAVVDFGRVTQALAEEVTAAGGEIRCGTAAAFLRRRGDAAAVGIAGGEVVAPLVVACPGLQSDRLARTAGAPTDPRIVPFRGDWWALRPERAGLVRGLVYPAPDPRLPFLGVHATRGIDGRVLVGPNAVLALAREGYRRGAVHRDDLLDLARHPGVWRLMARHAGAGLAELVRDRSPRLLVRALRRYLPEVGVDDLEPAGSGIRAQALGADGRLVDDFLLWRDGPVVVVRNAPSPAATASLAIARLVADRVLGREDGTT